MVAFACGKGCLKCKKPWTKRRIPNWCYGFFLCDGCKKRLDKMVGGWLKDPPWVRNGKLKYEVTDVGKMIIKIFDKLGFVPRNW